MKCLALLSLLLVAFPLFAASDGFFRKVNRKIRYAKEQDTARDFAFASYYQNNMVLQREPLSALIWGYGAIGAIVNISVNVQDIYMTKVVKGYDGRGIWSVKIKPQPAGATADIQGVQDNHGVLQWILLKNLLFGDVYVCSGQSNMQLSMSMILNSSKELDDTVNYPNIRVLTVAENFSSTPLYDLAAILQPWSIPSPKTIGGPDWAYFSAVCWLYGKYLYDELKIPIGLVATNWGGTPIESWSPPSVFQTCNEHISRKKLTLHHGHGYHGYMDNSQLFNAMIHPLLNMTIKGVIWDQGEQNTVTHTNSYQCMFPNMIRSWRKEWYLGSHMSTEPDFPFGFVQVGDKLQDQPTDGNYAVIRWHQTADYGYVPNPDLEKTFMAVTIDLPDPHSPYGSVHTRDKQDVAMRLVAAALSVVYHHTSVYDGPFPEKVMETKDHKIVIQYSSYQQLKVSDLGHFQVCCQNCSLADGEDDKKWNVAQILEHADHTITLDAKSCSKDFKMVDTVRYAWGLSPCLFKKCSVYNTLQFPAAPFYLSVDLP